MNLQQAICLRMGNPKPWRDPRNPRNLLRYLILCALAIVLVMLAEANE